MFNYDHKKRICNPTKDFDFPPNKFRFLDLYWKEPEILLKDSGKTLRMFATTPVADGKHDMHYRPLEDIDFWGKNVNFKQVQANPGKV